ncbi:nitrate reductase cytochrome c-type subunit [Lysobacter niastensis]|nr:nitrate reductase cytochrome c-type subunit [Lysobacter niastensis]
MDKRNKPLWPAIVLLLAMMALMFLAGLMVGRGSKRPPPDTAAPAPKAVAVTSAASALGRTTTRQLDGLRRGVPVDQEASPLPMARVENVDRKRLRAYPMQPPTIPHSIDGYQVDKNSNRCMLCHARANAEKFQAPPVSVTHYMDRDDQFLATISPRRYFCNQCHVVQTDAQPLVANNFEDIDTVMAAAVAESGSVHEAAVASKGTP